MVQNRYVGCTEHVLQVKMSADTGCSAASHNMARSRPLPQVWQTKIAALGCLGSLTARAPDQMSAVLPDIIPAVTAIMGDAKPQVKVG